MFIRHDLSRRSASGGIGGAAVLLATVLGTAPLAAQTAADSDENGGDDTVVLRNMLPEQFDMNDGVIGYRIVGGFAAKPGAWPSMIVLHDRTFDNGRWRYKDVFPRAHQDSRARQYRRLYAAQRSRQPANPARLHSPR